MGCKFDSKDLEQLKKVVNDIPAAINKVSQEASVKIKSLVLQEFDNSTDPFGNTWMPNKTNTQTLVRTGAMRSSLTVESFGREITAKINLPADYHQTGTINMVARPILPIDSIPPSWEEAINRIVQQILSEAMGKSSGLKPIEDGKLGGENQ